MVVLALGGAGLEAVLGGNPQVGRARVENDLTGEEWREGGKEGESRVLKGDMSILFSIIAACLSLRS
jgi:hypothetical protein